MDTSFARKNRVMKVLLSVADPDLELRRAPDFCRLPCRLFFLFFFTQNKGGAEPPGPFHRSTTGYWENSPAGLHGDILIAIYNPHRTEMICILSTC